MTTECLCPGCNLWSPKSDWKEGVFTGCEDWGCEHPTEICPQCNLETDTAYGPIKQRVRKVSEGMASRMELHKKESRG